MTDFLIKTSIKTSIKWENITYKLKRSILVFQKDIIKICIFLAKMLLNPLSPNSDQHQLSPNIQCQEIRL